MTTKRPVDEKLQRLIDANLNRLKEGLRVIEDIARYILDEQVLTQEIKSLRHQTKLFYLPERINHRDIVHDVAKKTTDSERKRNHIEDIVLANFSRSQESARVLEEVLKLSSPMLSEKAKQMRYALYDIEKRLIESLAKHEQTTPHTPNN